VIQTEPVLVGLKVEPPSMVRVTPLSEPVLAMRIEPVEDVPPAGSSSTVICRTPPDVLPVVAAE
jgi:hypothetical protein